MGKMDAEQYPTILEDHLLSGMENSGLSEEDITLKQDNDPKCFSKRAQTWLNLGNEDA
jgi:hypothetical protein